jgi:hypothetical protein
MADFKRRTLYLSTGKQIKLFGNSIAIGKSLEFGEGYAPNIFSLSVQQVDENEDPISEKDNSEKKLSLPKMALKTPSKVSNPYRLTPDEILEIADFNIRLWMDLKDRIREYGAGSPKIFGGGE